MSGVFNLCNVLQFVIDSFNQSSLPKQYLISDTHQGVLHIILDLSNRLYTIKKEVLEQSLADISLVRTQFSLYVFQKLSLFQWFHPHCRE